MKKLGITALLLGLSIATLWAQDDVWEARKQITGYVATEFNYLDNIEGHSKDYGMALTEAGLLVNYQPLQKLTLKAVAVYRPGLTVDQVLNELNAEYKIDDYLKIKVGRFLTPLSPINTYYYAPVNVSATLPMITNLHEAYPMTMDAVSFNGSVGNDLKFGYNAFAGGYHNTINNKTGALGFFGTESNYFYGLGEAAYSLDFDAMNSSLNFAYGLHAQLSYKDILTVGYNIIKEDPQDIDLFVNELGSAIPVEMNANINGINIAFKYKTLQVIGELWNNDVSFATEERNISDKFVIISNTFGKFTPYTRYEAHKMFGTDIKRYTAGVNFKPIFETTFKLEYLFYDYQSYDINGIVATAIYSF